eukprot:m.108201 g.108201  ORF g.108201 m.108201 type:complete len:274 (+) comp22619_c0_seq2:449-1270(+)
MDLLLDVYVPVGAPKPRPAYILMHGGANTGGDKNTAPMIGSANFFAKRGFVAFNIDYRLKPDNGTRPRFPSSRSSSLQWGPTWDSGYPAVRDLKAAIRFVRANAERYGVDKTRIAISGGSAGATNSVAAGVVFENDYKTELTLEEDPTLATTHLNESSSVQCVVAHWSSDGEIGLIQEYDPRHLSRFSTDNAPIFEFHGDQDTTINITHAYAVQKAYQKTGVAYELQVLKGCGHASWCYGCLPCPQARCGNYCEDMDHEAFPFVVKHLNLTLV